jgi:hypothetical protein
VTAAQEHLQAVHSSQAEIGALDTTARGLITEAETAAAAITGAFDTVTELVKTAIAASVTANDTIGQAIGAGEIHVESSAVTGHSTDTYARAAKDDCDNAQSKMPAVLELLEATAAALTEAKTQSIAALGGALAPTTDATEGVGIIAEHLIEAEGHINQAIHSH